MYANVKNSHIVPASYLRSWAIESLIGVHLVAEKRDLVQPFQNVGTRRRYYRRTRPDGTPWDDVEWSLSKLESVAAPLLRQIDDRWPPDDDDKSKLAHLFAYQLLRTPRHKLEYENLVRKAMTDFRSSDQARGVSAEQLASCEAALLTDTHRLTRMLVSGMTLTSVFASTHWTLIEFGSSVLATSDQPAVLWPGAGARVPQPTSTLEAGVIECIEYRFPLSPTRALLMTWSDMPDDEYVRVRGSHHHAMNLNAFTIASADRQWFYVPGTRPPRAAGLVSPLSLELVPGYTAEGATTSQRRAQARILVESKSRRDLSDQEIMRVKIARRAPTGTSRRRLI